MTKIIINGAKGRMGKALIACAAGNPQLQVVGQIDQGDDIGSVIGQGDVVVEFSLHSATLGVAEACAKHRKPIVIGTTGHTDAERSRIAELKSVIPMVWSSNYSTGVNVLFWLTRKAVDVLGPGYDLEIVEMHHRMKQDAPSGTARTLAEILASSRQQALDQTARHGRVGIVGKRTATEIGIHSVRGGDVVGDHTVIFAGTGERLELTHRATSRDTLASGALRAAQWIIGHPPGIYDMQDVLGLR